MLLKIIYVFMIFLLNEEIYETICSFIYKYKMDTITEIDTHDIIEGLCNALGNYEITMDDIETNYEKVIDVISYFYRKGR